MIKLYVDCETDMEKASFFRSSRGWESGIVAKSLEGDLADVFAFRATVAEALAALRAELNSEIAYCSDDDSDYDEGVQFAMTKLDETITALNLAHKEG